MAKHLCENFPAAKAISSNMCFTKAAGLMKLALLIGRQLNVFFSFSAHVCLTPISFNRSYTCRKNGYHVFPASKCFVTLRLDACNKPTIDWLQKSNPESWKAMEILSVTSITWVDLAPLRKGVLGKLEVQCFETHPNLAFLAVLPVHTQEWEESKWWVVEDIDHCRNLHRHALSGHVAKLFFVSFFLPSFKKHWRWVNLLRSTWNKLGLLSCRQF